MVATATDVPLADDIDGTLPAVPPDPDLLTEIGDELGLGSSLTRFRAVATKRRRRNERSKHWRARRRTSRRHDHDQERGRHVTSDPALYPSERLTQVADAVRVKGIDVLLLTPGPRPALRHRLRRQAAGAADLPRDPGDRATPSCSCRGWN